MERIKKGSLSEATRMLQTCVEGKKRKEPRTQREWQWKTIDHRYPALKQNHVSSSRKRQYNRPLACFNGHSQRPVAKDWHCSGLDNLSPKQTGQWECYQSSFRRVKGTDRTGRIRGDCDDLTRCWGTVVQMGQQVTEALGRQNRGVGKLIPFGGRR